MRTAKTNKRYSIISLFQAVSVLIMLPSLAFSGASPQLVTLDDAFARAITVDERIKIAEREIAKSHILSDKAATYWWPSMSAYGGYFEANEEVRIGAYTATSATGLGPFDVAPVDRNMITPKGEWRGKFEFLQPLYRGAYFPLKDQAEKIIERSTETFYQTVQDTLLEVERVYFEILKIKELVLNAGEICKLAQEELDIAKVKFEAGQATEDIVLKAELYVTEAERKKIEYRNDLRSAKDDLGNLIGIENVCTDFDVVKPHMRTVPERDYDFLLNIAYENRYDHEIALLNVNVAESDVDIVKARFHPTLQATWDYYISDHETLSRDNEAWIAAITMEIPILEGTLRFRDLKEKKEALSQARLNLDARKKKIRIQVQDAILQIDSFESVLKNLEKQVELAQKNYDIISTQFEYGSATSLYLNEALTDLDSAKTALIHATYSQQQVLIDLERVLGIYAHDYINSIIEEKEE
jgi:outer membrane protein